jgi:hypothetical protein
MNKFTYSMLALLIIAGLVLFGGFAEYFSYAITAIIPLLAILAWFNNVSGRRDGKSEVQSEGKSKDSDVTEDDAEEYHNDFSKVPAGTPDPFQPPPRSIGYGYGDGGRSTIEDLERIGIVETDPKKRSE